ncbi:794_t:CDS:2, partial [Acaulospora colombiana]
PGDVECNNPHCGTKYASAWRTNPEGGWLCNACGIFIRTKGFHRPPEVINRVYKTAITTQIAPKKDSLRKRKNPETNVAVNARSKDEPLPWSRKEYLKCGLYSMDLKVNKSTKRNSKETVKEVSSEVFPLPVQYGQFLMTERRDFRLPWDIMTAHKLGLLQREYKKIQTNIYIDRKRKNEKPVICDCKPPSDGGPGCTED